LLERHHAAAAAGRLETRVADMEALPFADGEFDAVACAGSLSYGDPDTVDASVRRVLKSGGSFLSVDSLNDNPIYRLNRWRHYRRGERSLSTLRRMPDSARLASWRTHYDDVAVRYFGAATWAMPLAIRLLGQSRAASLSDSLDRMLNVKRSAFKFVAIARGRR
jgi:SAM-dependent methyltransferase